MYKKQRYRIISGHSRFRKHKKVRVSECDGNLYFFEDADDGIYIGEARATRAPERSEEYEKRKKNTKEEQKEYELIGIFLEQNGMKINDEKLYGLYHHDGLTLETAMTLVSENKERYGRYAGEKGFFSFNLFIGDFIEFKNRQIDPVKYNHVMGG